jgi:hypothetical protein
MNLWLLSRTDQIGWDEYDSFVVRAENEQEARELASKKACGTGWPIDSVTCTQVQTDGPPEVIERVPLRKMVMSDKSVLDRFLELHRQLAARYQDNSDYKIWGVDTCDECGALFPSPHYPDCSRAPEPTAKGIT